jgi:hypothetical protein
MVDRNVKDHMPVFKNTGDSIVLENDMTFSGDITFSGSNTTSGDETLSGNTTIGASNLFKLAVTTKEADEDIDGQTMPFIEIDGTSANVQLTNLEANKGQLMVITCSDSSNTTTVTCKSGTTFDGTNDIATFDAAGETLVLFAISDTQFVIIENIGSVGLSSS